MRVGGGARHSFTVFTVKTNNEKSKMSNTNQSHSNQNFEHQQNDNEQIETGTVSSALFPAASWQLPLLTVITRRSRLKT
jgi:hypothetical protein